MLSSHLERKLAILGSAGVIIVLDASNIVKHLNTTAVRGHSRLLTFNFLYKVYFRGPVAAD